MTEAITDEMPEQPPSPYPPYRVADFEQASGFFHFQLRDWIQIIVLVIMAALFIFQRQSDVASLSNNLSNLTITVSSLSATVENLKKITDGTAADIRLQADRNIEQDRRIAEAQQQLITLVPDMREIKTKLNFVADLLDERTKSHK